MSVDDIKVYVTYHNSDDFKEIYIKDIDCDRVAKIKVHFSYMSTLASLRNCTALIDLNISHNNITSLDGLQNCTALQILYITDNNISSLDGLQNCTALLKLYVFNNAITSLDGLQNCTALQTLDVENNKLTSLDDLQNCTALQSLDVSYNNINSLDGLQNCNALNYLNITYNTQITILPNFLLEFRNIQHILYIGLELELDARQRRWLNRLQNRNSNEIQVYGNSQNVHDSSIQETVRTSMRRLLNQPNLHKLSTTSLDTLRDQIVVDSVLTPKSKDQLLTYISGNEELLELSLTYGELLWAVWQTIHNPDLHHNNDTNTNGFNDETQREIKQILNQELDDSDCMCFTGRMTRLVNCLNGFSPLVEVRILDGAQIGNILVTIKERLEASEEGYSVKKHREMFRKEMLDRGESVTVIEEWLEYIE